MNCECDVFQGGKLTEAVETLLSLEKQTRTAADMHSTSKLLVAIVKMCYEQKDYPALNENIVLLTKRRGQLKQVSQIKMSSLTVLVGQQSHTWSLTGGTLCDSSIKSSTNKKF